MSVSLRQTNCCAAISAVAAANLYVIGLHGMQFSECFGVIALASITPSSAHTMRLVLGVLFVAIGCVQMGRCQDYSERYRLQVHFSVPFGWLNDPNGVVYHDGQYHLFYQHHPHSTKWGPMHWGHAQSTDLIHWQNMPIALRPYGNGTIFSGCCVVDAHNHTGLAAPNAAADTLVALYTFDESGNQSQAMAFSSDNGLCCCWACIWCWLHFFLCILPRFDEDFR